ncbi:hypothetical protein AAMO2058_001009300 [Amorphochlora amoebiformis]|uniref:Plastid light harvesting protein n=1 Tax=Amorphochlora amoebiformis TaxID=1561963 RepID=A0A7S0H992_9EUKA
MKLSATLLAAAATCLAVPSTTTASKASSRLSRAVRPHFQAAVNKVRKDFSAKSEVTGSPEPKKPVIPDGTAPMGKFWDPAGFTKQVSDNQIRRYREAEITHGRLGMLGVLGFLTQESFHPLFGGNIDGPAISHFEKITEAAPTFWYPTLLAIAIAELGRARIGWQDPFDGGSMFALRDAYVPGDIGFDPLGLKPTNPKDLENIQNKELNNGRLAMLALAGFMAQELVNGKPILENLQ